MFGIRPFMFDFVNGKGVRICDGEKWHASLQIDIFKEDGIQVWKPM